jgi:hypothetical protein
MVFILKDADFSANNVGTIEIPVELNEETLAILAKTTKYSESSSQTLALDAFITALKRNGLWSKIALFVPTFMAASTTEMAYDVISDAYLVWTNAGTYNSANDTYASASKYGSYVTIPQLKAIDNFHLHFKKSTCALSIDSNKINIAIGRYYNTNYPGVNVGTFNVNKNYYDAELSYYNYGRGLFNLKSASLDSDGSKFYGHDHQGELESCTLTQSSTYDAGVVSNYSLSTKMIIGYHDTSAKTIKQEFHIIGNTALTDSEATALIEAAHTLFISLGGEDDN